MFEGERCPSTSTYGTVTRQCDLEAGHALSHKSFEDNQTVAWSNTEIVSRYAV